MNSRLHSELCRAQLFANIMPTCARLGRSCRRKFSRSSRADWDAKKCAHDPIDVVLASTYERVPELIPIKMARMGLFPGQRSPRRMPDQDCRTSPQEILA